MISNMNDTFVSSLHIQKLGHKLEEIRVRALNHIISKLDHVVISEIEFSRYLELLKKLFQWFDCIGFTEEEKVLNLIYRILNSTVGSTIIKHIGTIALLRDLKDIRIKIATKYYPIIDKSIVLVESFLENPNSDLQLISDLPLSYRSDQTTVNTANYDLPNVSSRTQTSKKSYYNSTATPYSGIEQKSSSVSGLQTGAQVETITLHTPISPIRDILYRSIPYVTLNWQPLVESDCHVLKSVEHSLEKPPQPLVLINSCDFFCNVMLQDFPAEVFLQQPKILTLFYDIVKNSPSTRITNAVLICLNKLTENLITRIRFYSDPCTFNMKQGTSLMYEPDTNTTITNRNVFNYNIEMSNLGAGDSPDDNRSLDQKTLPQYCIQTFVCALHYIAEKPLSFKDNQNKKRTQSGLNVSLQLINKLVSLTSLCIKPAIWTNRTDGTILEVSKQVIDLFSKLGDVLEQYRLMVVATDMEYFERMAQLHLLHSTDYLLSEIVPISLADAILPRSLKNALSNCLLDAAFGRLFPSVHESLVQFVNMFKGHSETESLTKYNDVKNVSNAMSKAVKILNYYSNSDNIENLQIIHDSLPCFEFHKNLNIINIFLKICIKNTSVLNSQKSYLRLIKDILLSLLSHSDLDIQKETYALCQKLVVNILGLNHAKHINESDPGSQVIFMFQPEIFIEISAHGLTNDSLQIQTYAEDILIHILKCKLVVSDNVWKELIKALIPAMPILQSFVDMETPLGKAVFKIFDPDVSTTLFMSPLDTLKGNIRLLFCRDVSLRYEAASRLCWLLTMEEDASYKIPKIKSLDDRGLSNIFQIDYCIDLSRKRSAIKFYEVSSLQKVVELLSTENIEPSIRRSALTQISVMLEDYLLHTTFLELNGLKLILDILQNSLLEDQYENYPDSVIPVVSIIKNICLHNSVIRQELSLNSELIYNLLRALFIYCTDKRMQNDGAVLTSLLLFSEFAIYSFSGKDFSGFSLPEIVVQKFKIPIKCHTHWKTSRYVKPSLFEFLMADDWCRSTLRMHWNIEWYGGVSELINWNQAPVLSLLTPEQLSEFSSDLRLTKPDLLSLKASSVSYCCQQYLFNIENATTHQFVVEAVRGIAGYVGLWLLTNKSGVCIDQSILKLPWESAFSRFLSAPPANPDDQNLLIEIIRCLTIMIKLYKNTGKTCWIIKILQDPGHYLPKLLHLDTKNDNRSISLELLTLISDCSTLEQHLLDVGLISGLNQEESENKSSNWIHVMKMITENLKFSDTEQFYNLAYLDKLLSCLVQITSNIGWSGSNFNLADFHKIFTELIEALSELLTSFHYGKGTEAASSFMGLSIIRNSLLTLNHILFEMQQSMKKNWESFWICDTICCSTIFGLFSLWSCRDVVIRAATLQLLSGLACSPRGATTLIENVRQKYGGLWETSIMILIDHNEASIVREHAANLLANLCSHTNVSTSGQVTLPLCHAPLSSNKHISGSDAVLFLLKEYNFYEELNVLLSFLHLETTYDPSLITVSNSKSVQATSARSFVHTSTESVSTQEGSTIFVTPSFVKAAASLVNNLLYLASESISEAMADFGLIRGFFRCLSTPTLDLIDSKSFLLYTDTLEMNTVICSLLTRAITINDSCRTMTLHTRDCLHVLISLLNTTLYNVEVPHFLYLRNQLWSEIYRFLTALLEISPEKSKTVDSKRESFNIITTLLNECGHESFFKSVCQSMEGKSLGLQKSALQSLTSLLTVETILPPKKIKESTSFSLQNLLDTARTPRDSQEDIENIDPNSESSQRFSKHSSIMQSLIVNYQSNITAPKNTKSILTDTSKRRSNSPNRSNRSNCSNRSSDVNTVIGADLCKILLKLYEMQNLDTLNKDTKRKTIITGALSSLLNTSEEAKKFALNQGLLTTVLNQLKSLHYDLSLHSAESFRKISEKKKVCPILKEVDSLFCMLTNFIVGNENAKNSASDLNLADLVHKFWVWFNFERNLLINILKLLCTFTTNCNNACHSLTLTNSLPGSGPRKIATNLSLLNAIINLITKEMELVSRSHDSNILQLSFQVLINVCSVTECRTVLTKSNLFHCLNRLHPAITKRQRPWETIENIWLEFLEIFTFYPEGQLHVTKTNDILELVLTLAANLKTANKTTALSVLRNVSFHHSNRIKLLASVEFIQVLHNKLTNGTINEKNIVVSMIWALVANSQRSKIAIKCAGLDVRIQEVLRQYEIQGIHDKSYQTMLYVLGILKEGEK